MKRVGLIERGLTGSVIGAFFEVYHALGYGYLEHIYACALERELLERGHRVMREVTVRVLYKGNPIGFPRLDMIVDDKVLVETKSTYELPVTAKRQVLNYLRATNLEIGLLLHFGPDARFYRFVSANKPSRPRIADEG